MSYCTICGWVMDPDCGCTIKRAEAVARIPKLEATIQDLRDRLAVALWSLRVHRVARPIPRECGCLGDNYCDECIPF